MPIDELKQKIDVNKNKKIETAEIINFLKNDKNVQELGKRLDKSNGWGSTWLDRDKNKELYGSVASATLGNQSFQKSIKEKINRGVGGLTESDIFLLYLQSKVDSAGMVPSVGFKPLIILSKSNDVYMKYGGWDLLKYIRKKYNNPKYEFWKGWPRLSIIPNINRPKNSLPTVKQHVELPTDIDFSLFGENKTYMPKEFSKLETRAKNNYLAEYNKEKNASRKRNAEKGNRINDYIQYDLYIFSLRKYQELIEEKHRLIKNGIYVTEKNFDIQEKLAKKYFEDLEKINNEYPEIQEISKKIKNYSDEVAKLQKKYLIKEKEETAQIKYESYTAEVEKKGNEMGIKEIKDSFTKEPTSSEDVIKFFENMNKLEEFQAAQEVIKKKYGKTIDNYESYMNAKGNLIKEYGKDNLQKRMNRYKEYSEKVDNCKNQNRGFDIGKYENYINKITESDIGRHLENAQILYRSIHIENNTCPKNFPISGIKEDLENIRKKQSKTNQRWENLKNKSRVLYQICNIGSRGINALVSSTRGTGAKLGALITSLWHDDDEMVAVWERTGNGFYNPHFKISEKQSESVYKDGKIVFNWDNGPGIVAESVVNMITLVSGGGAITKGVAKGATKVGVWMGEKVASGIGLVSSGFIEEVGKSCEEGFKAGMTGNQALLYGTVGALLQGSLELISPNEFINGAGKNLAKTYIKELLKTESKQNLKAIGKLFLKNVGSEIFEENIQEAIQLTAGNLVNMRANDKYNLIGDNKLDSDWNLKNFAATALITTLTTGIVTGGGFAMQTPGILNNQNKIQLIEGIKNNQKLYSDVMNVLDKTIAGKIKIPNVDIQQLQNLKGELNGNTDSYFNGKSHKIFEGNTQNAESNSKFSDRILSEINEQNESDKLQELRQKIGEQYKQATGEELNLTDEQLLSIIDAHEQDGKLGELTLGQLRQKVKVLQETITDPKVRRFLLEAGFCGKSQEIHKNINNGNQNYEITYRGDYGEMKITNPDGTITNIDFQKNGGESKYLEIFIENGGKIENYTTIEQLCKISEEMGAGGKIGFAKELIRNLDNVIDKQILEKLINSENFSENAIEYDKYNKRHTFTVFEKILSFNVKLPQKLFNKNFLTQLINSNTFFEARAKVNYQGNELNKIYFHEMIGKYIDGIDLNSCNPELLSDLIIDYHFDKISYNVFLDIKELLRFQIEKGNFLSKEKLKIYRDILNIDKLSNEEKIELHKSLIGKNVAEMFENDIQQAREISKREIVDSVLNHQSIEQYKDEDLTKRYGINVYNFDGQPFYALAKGGKIDRKNPEHAVTRSFSLIGTECIGVRGDPGNHTFLYEGLTPQQVIHISNDDSGSGSGMHDEYGQKTDYVFRLGSPSELLSNTRSYNELLILEKGTGNTVENNQLNDIKPIAIYCYEITEDIVKTAKEYGVGIALINKNKYGEKNTPNKGHDSIFEQYTYPGNFHKSEDYYYAKEGRRNELCTFENMKEIENMIEGKSKETDYFDGKSKKLFEGDGTQARGNSKMMDNLLNEVNREGITKAEITDKLNELRKEISEQYKQSTGEELQLTDEQLLSILDAHEQDGKLGELTLGQLRQKVKTLAETITDPNVRRFLLEAGFCGQEGINDNYKLDINRLAEKLNLKQSDIEDIEVSIQSIYASPERYGINLKELPIFEILSDNYERISDLLKYSGGGPYMISMFFRDFLACPNQKLSQLKYDKNKGLQEILSNFSEDIKKKCKKARIDIDEKLRILKGEISLDKAKQICSDEKIIELANNKEGTVNKHALELSMKLKKWGYDYDEIELLFKCNNNEYIKIAELIEYVQKDLSLANLAVNEIGHIIVSGKYSNETNILLLRDYYGADFYKDLSNGAYRFEYLLNFYLIDGGKYFDYIKTYDIKHNISVAYGIRGLTYIDKRYYMSPKKQSFLADLICESAHNPSEKEKRILKDYKGVGYERINKTANDPKNKDSKILSDYLDRMPLREDIEVVREDPQRGVAEKINLSVNGEIKTLSDILRDNGECNESDLEQTSFIRDRFISTTLHSQGAFGNNPVIWHFTVKKGVGACFLDVMGLDSEGEILLDKNCKITITKLDVGGGIANIYATVDRNQTLETTDTVGQGNNDYFNGKSQKIFKGDATKAELNSKTSDRILKEIDEKNKPAKLEELRKEITTQYKESTGEMLELSEEQLLSILDAHEQDGKLGELTLGQLKIKVKILSKAITDPKVRRFLLEAGFCGMEYSEKYKIFDKYERNINISKVNLLEQNILFDANAPSDWDFLSDQPSSFLSVPTNSIKGSEAIYGGKSRIKDNGEVVGGGRGENWMSGMKRDLMTTEGRSKMFVEKSPIELNRIKGFNGEDLYWVANDGNHRVVAAKEIGLSHILAEVKDKSIENGFEKIVETGDKTLVCSRIVRISKGYIDGEVKRNPSGKFELHFFSGAFDGCHLPNDRLSRYAYKYEQLYGPINDKVENILNDIEEDESKIFQYEYDNKKLNKILENYFSGNLDEIKKEFENNDDWMNEYLLKFL